MSDTASQSRSEKIKAARVFPIPNRWKPVELPKTMGKIDLAPYFKDWVSCPHCNKGMIEVRVQKAGYAVVEKKQCRHCHGQGGWHKNKPGNENQDITQAAN